MNALLVFAEHRYYGESLPTKPTSKPSECLRYLTTEQAIADYATLIRALRLKFKDDDNSIPFIGFGGSYGGMLGAWMRMRFPDALDGMLAASAPILSFEGLTPAYNPSMFDIIASRDAGGPGSGAAPACADNVLAAWDEIRSLATTTDGRKTLSTAFKTCSPITTKGEAEGLIGWIQGPIGYMAMGNYPFPSDYMTHGDGHPMVAWPMRVACAGLATPKMSGAALMVGMREFAKVWYNRTGINAKCLFNSAHSETGVIRDVHTGDVRRARRPMTRVERDGRSSESCGGSWGYQYCTQMVQPFASGLGKDMFYPPSPWNVTRIVDGCKNQYGVQCRPDWVNVGFPGSRLDDGRFSKIIFTNGYLDPWSGGGVLQNISAKSELWAYVLPNGAHHLDLMWSHPEDPPDALDARRFIEVAIRRWIK